MVQTIRSCTAFSGTDRVASGSLAKVACVCKEIQETNPDAGFMIFDDATAEPVEVDLRGTAGEVAIRYGDASEESPAESTSALRRGPGRPKLGVIGREVTLLPRHWEWLNARPGGASVALRKLVEQALRENAGADAARSSQDAAFRFMSAMAGNETGYEEALRALYAADEERFDAQTASWPKAVRTYAKELAALAFKHA